MMKKLLVCLIVAGGVMGLAAYAQGFFDPVDRDPHGKVLIEVAGQYPHEDYVLQVTIGLRMYDTHSGTVVVSGQVFDNASLPVKAAYEQWITDSLVSEELHLMVKTYVQPYSNPSRIYFVSCSNL